MIALTSFSQILVYLVQLRYYANTADGLFFWKVYLPYLARVYNDHLHVCRESGQPRTLMVLLHADPNSYSREEWGIQLSNIVPAYLWPRYVGQTT